MTGCRNVIQSYIRFAIAQFFQLAYIYRIRIRTTACHIGNYFAIGVQTITADIGTAAYLYARPANRNGTIACSCGNRSKGYILLGSYGNTGFSCRHFHILTINKVSSICRLADGLCRTTIYCGLERRHRII